MRFGDRRHAGSLLGTATSRARAARPGSSSSRTGAAAAGAGSPRASVAENDAVASLPVGCFGASAGAAAALATDRLSRRLAA